MTLDALMSEARNWIADCEWPDVDDVSDLSDVQVALGIARHFDGGWPTFAATCDTPTECAWLLAVRRFGLDVANRMFP